MSRGSAAAGLPFEYAVLRIVPRVDRGESVNGAVLLYCQRAEFLDAALRRDLSCVLALHPGADLEAIRGALEVACAVARGGPAGGGAGDADAGRRFRWLTAPRSAVVQPGPVHTGITADPAATLARLASRLLD
jgi:hypothetical protein